MRRLLRWLRLRGSETHVQTIRRPRFLPGTTLTLWVAVR